jgi:hypothetical protein
MNRLMTIAVAAVSALLLGIALSAANANAQSAKDVVGTWAIASADTVRPDGGRAPNYGSHPKGIVMFGANGRYAFILARSGQPKFASNNRMEGTPDENKAVVQGIGRALWQIHRQRGGQDHHVLHRDEYISELGWSGAEATVHSRRRRAQVQGGRRHGRRDGRGGVEADQVG